ncbi:MAG: hypothetical protein J0H64_10365 [Actinobacteria bacterium]|nr:hypothetical protein [Actinomycetota bacterium]
MPPVYARELMRVAFGYRSIDASIGLAMLTSAATDPGYQGDDPRISRKNPKSPGNP